MCAWSVVHVGSIIKYCSLIIVHEITMINALRGTRKKKQSNENESEWQWTSGREQARKENRESQQHQLKRYKHTRLSSTVHLLLQNKIIEKRTEKNHYSHHCWLLYSCDAQVQSGVIWLLLFQQLSHIRRKLMATHTHTHIHSYSNQ